MEIDVVLPCLNEAGALPWVLARMPAGYRPVVADNGSTDDSAAIAARPRRAHVTGSPLHRLGLPIEPFHARKSRSAKGSSISSGKPKKSHVRRMCGGSGAVTSNVPASGWGIARLRACR